jgi:hypothetical protein
MRLLVTGGTGVFGRSLRPLAEAAVTSERCPGAVYVQPTVTFVYAPEGRTSEDTPVREVRGARLERALHPGRGMATAGVDS